MDPPVISYKKSTAYWRISAFDQLMQARSFEPNATGDILNVTIITARLPFICSTQDRTAFTHQRSSTVNICVA